MIEDYTRIEFAEIAGVSVRTVDYWLALPSGEHLPYSKIGYRVRIPAPEAEKWMIEHHKAKNIKG